MIRLLKQIRSSEKGQALAIVLALLVFGALVIVPSLGYAATSLNSNRIIEEDVNGIYAADAGVEDALWLLAHGASPSELPEQLSQNVNQMEVAIQCQDKGSYTLVLGEMIDPKKHCDFLTVDSEMVEEAAGVYRYTITITWHSDPGTPPMQLDGVGARIPVDYEYDPLSASGFPENLSTGEPVEPIDEDALGAQLPNWELAGSWISEDDPVQTQTFLITGEGSPEGYYAWVIARRGDVGMVGEISGNSYRITATATRPGDGKTTARIAADAIIGGGITYIISWQISS